MVELITGLRAGEVRANLERVRSEIAAAGRDPDTVQILAAVKYVSVEELGVLAEAGLTLLGENRAQDLIAKADAYPETFTWDFIGHLQSRKVRQILPYVRYVETVASESALEQLRRHGTPSTQVLLSLSLWQLGHKDDARRRLTQVHQAVAQTGFCEIDCRALLREADSLIAPVKTGPR